MGNNQLERQHQPIQQAIQAQENQTVQNTAVNAVRIQQQHNMEVNQLDAARRAIQQAMPPVQVRQNYNLQDLDGLIDTNITRHLIQHIFRGEINGREQVVGYHYEGVQGSEGYFISERSLPDALGVYTARVRVNNTDKIADSTFFPINMSPQDVVDCIKQAHANRRQITGNLYRGIGSNNIVIEMRINDDIISTAYPLSEERRQIEQQERGQQIRQPRGRQQIRQPRGRQQIRQPRGRQQTRQSGGRQQTRQLGGGQRQGNRRRR